MCALNNVKKAAQKELLALPTISLICPRSAYSVLLLCFGSREKGINPGMIFSTITSIYLESQQPMTIQIIAIVNQKGGVGKTTTGGTWASPWQSNERKSCSLRQTCKAAWPSVWNSPDRTSCLLLYPRILSENRFSPGRVSSIIWMVLAWFRPALSFPPSKCLWWPPEPGSSFAG